MKQWVVFLSCLLLSSFILASDWNAKSEFSYLSETGNSEIETVGVRNDIIYELPLVKFNGKLNFISTKDQKEITSENYFVEEKIDWKYQTPEYFFQLVNWEKDKFRNLDSRLTTGIGYGINILELRKFIPGEKFVVEVGGQQTWERHINGNTTKFSSLRTFTLYEYQFSKSSLFANEIEYIYEFDKTEGYRFNSETSLITTLNDRFSLKTSYAVKYDANPVGNAENIDTKVIISIVVNLK